MLLEIQVTLFSGLIISDYFMMDGNHIVYKVLN